MKKVISKTFINIFFLAFAVFISSVDASANLLDNFRSSKKRPVNQRKTVNTASRSNCIPTVGKREIELLVPNISVAHNTSSANPSLYIYSRVETPLSPVFTLLDPKSPYPLVEKRIKIHHRGVKRISLPDKVKLENNKVYLWNLAIPCQNTSKSFQIVLSAGIQKVKVPPQVQLELDGASSNLEKIDIYNKHGLWYETIDLVLQGLSEQEVSMLLSHDQLF